MLKKIIIALAGVLGAIVLLAVALGQGWFGDRQHAGNAEGPEIPKSVIAEREHSRSQAAGALNANKAKQILFGDLHVHSTFSRDAFSTALPLTGRDGAHPIAEACDFARYCSALDFWSINDHVFSFDQRQWTETKEAIRQCNAVAGDPANPDLVSFLGWEWTQMGSRPDNHYGHKNVIFLETSEDLVPARPIGAASAPDSLAGAAARQDPFKTNLFASVFAPGGDRQAYFDLSRYTQDAWDRTPCPEGVHVKELPLDCYENVATPGELFKKLDEWGAASIVIPHGTTWGFYTPEGSSFDKQLKADQHDPDRQFMVEIFSGHGNSEEYRSWREFHIKEDGSKICPPPQDSYTPACWRAGEIIEARCTAAGESATTCKDRAEDARHYYLAMVGTAGFRVVPGNDIQEWREAGQCTDCYLPSFNYRPRNSVQYMLALTNFDDPENPTRFEFGIMASSDNHSAKPGTGYKEMDRREMIEFPGRDSADIVDLTELIEEPTPYAVERQPGEIEPAQLVEFERQSSFFMTGGLIAAHSEGRDRNAIWQAWQDKEVYATTGERILLWFDRVIEEGGETLRQPMGSSATASSAPKFVVHAIGAFKQKSGCPDYTNGALTPERLERLCQGECYNPSDERKLITAIEVVRILPQQYKDEPVDGLIQDAWATFPCAPDQNGCTVEFEDPEFETLARDATYYVRAIQEPTPTINGGHLRCTYDSDGNCIKVNACQNDYRTDLENDCLTMKEEKAWSSPIFLTYAASVAAE
jgi:hypothetical protein